MSHTKGPWRNRDNQIQALDSEDCFNLTITQVDFTEGAEKECEANAKLIAAAPELLEALELLRDQYEKLFSEHYKGSAIVDDCNIYSLVNYVINKAKGKT